MSGLISIEAVASKIFFIRSVKVLLDRDLAALYGVETKALKQAVRRNIKRFPPDFMFELTETELKNWRSQFVTSNSVKMGLRYLPMAFTEQGVAMLSGILNSDRAIAVNIQIMRTFTKLRHMIFDNEDLKRELAELKEQTDDRFQNVFETLDQLLTVDVNKNKKIGFIVKEELRGYGKRNKYHAKTLVKPLIQKMAGLYSAKTCPPGSLNLAGHKEFHS